MICKFDKWVPPGIDTLKGIVVLTPPSQSDGRYMVADYLWREFAKKNDLALVACFFQDDLSKGSSWIETYCNMNMGAGDELLGYLYSEFGSDPLPKLFLFGFSAGGQFNYEFVNKYPDKVAAFVVNKGGVYFTALASEGARQVPGLFITGNEDASWRKYGVSYLHGVGVVAGARQWYFTEEQGLSHQLGNSEHYAVSFFQSVLDSQIFLIKR